MNSQSRPAPPGGPGLAKRDLADYGVARFRDQVFDAVLALWHRRRSEGWTQKQVADMIERDRGWVSRNLRAPGNWTLRTAGELIQALAGEAEIAVAALDDPIDSRANFDAYDGYLSPPKPKASYQFVSTISVNNRLAASIRINQGRSLEIAPMSVACSRVDVGAWV